MLVAAGLVLAGCGGSKHPKALTPTTSTLPSVHAAERKLFGNAYANPIYNQRPWAVVQIGRGKAAKAVVFHYVHGAWVVDRSNAVTLTILGPKPGSLQHPITQIAMTMKAKSPILQSGLWVDGIFIQGKVAGSPTNYTIYGAPTIGLPPGLHVVIGFAGTKTHGSAVTWTYRVP